MGETSLPSFRPESTALGSYVLEDLGYASQDTLLLSGTSDAVRESAREAALQLETNAERLLSSSHLARLITNSETDSPAPPPNLPLREEFQIEGQFQIAAHLQQLGEISEANAQLGQIARSDGASLEIRCLAQAMMELNNGEMSAARSFLEQIPSDESAQALLQQLDAGQAQFRQAQILSLWQGGIVAYVEYFRQHGGAGADLVQEELLQALSLAHQEVMSGNASSLNEAMRGMRNPHVLAFILDSHHASLLDGISNPNLSESEFNRAVLRAARSFLRQEDYVAALHFTEYLQNDPEVGAEARDLAAGIPTEAAIDAALSSLRAMTIVFADSDQDALESGVTTVATLGVARFGAVAVESAFAATSAARAVASISPIALRASRWALRAGSEAVLFTAGDMATQALLTGSTEQWTLENFGRQFGAMLVTFGLLHVVGMGMGSVARPLAERLTRAEAALVTARETGVGIEAATQALRVARVRAGGMTLLNWGSRVTSLTASGYLNEGLGLEEDQGISLGGRLFSSTAMDAHMGVAGVMAEGLSGGSLSRMERRAEIRYQNLVEEALNETRIEQIYFVGTSKPERGSGSSSAWTALLAAGLGMHLLAPELAHASAEIGQRSSDGIWPTAITGLGLLSVGVLGMVAQRKGPYREAPLRDVRLQEARDRFLDPQVEIRERTRAIEEFRELLMHSSHPEDIQPGVLELLNLAIAPKVADLEAHFAETPEDPARILRTRALSLVRDLLWKFPPEPVFRRRCIRKIEEFYRVAENYLRPEYIAAPKDWPLPGSQYFNSWVVKTSQLAPEGVDGENGLLDINEPLRSLAGNILNRHLQSGERRFERVTRNVKSPPSDAAILWHRLLSETPSLHFLYKALSLGLSGAGFATFFQATGLESGLGLGMAAIGIATTFTPELLDHFIIQPNRSRKARWTEYMADHAEYLRAQKDVGIQYPFAALRDKTAPFEMPLPKARVETEEDDWEAEMEEAIQRATETKKRDE